jgi:superfamily II DNA/RNA helicase
MAFLIPLVSRIVNAVETTGSSSIIGNDAVLGLVLSPIRELCVQLETQAKVW